MEEKSKRVMDLNWHETVVALIDTRSFSNLWFWIVLAVFWSSASHWVLGVPWDLVLRSKRVSGLAENDFRVILRINVNRIINFADIFEYWMLSIGCFILTALAVLGFGYSVEFAQAVFLLVLPMSIVGAASIITARRIQNDEKNVKATQRHLSRLRFFVQILGIVAIFFTSLWGMYQNFQFSPLG